MRYLILFLISFPTYAALNDVDKAYIVPTQNILKNPGFENGKGTWAASGITFAIVTSGTNLLTGKASGTWDSTGAAVFLTNDAITIPNGLYGRNGVASCLIQTPSGTATHSFSLRDGSADLVSTTITSSTVPTRTTVNFIFPSSGTVRIRITSNADEPLIAIDDCYVGPAEGFNVGSVSQAEFVGSIEFANDCTWTVSQSAFTANYTADASCTTTVAGSVSLLDATRPGVTISNAKPGRYVAIWSGNVYKNNANAFSCAFRFYDGTNVWGQSGAFANGVAAFGGGPIGDYTVTSPGTISLDLQGAGDGGVVACAVFGGGLTQNKIMVYRYPLSSDQSYTPEQVASSYSGYHDSTCSWARTNAAFGDPTADASCALVTNYNTNFGTVVNADSGGSALPGITFTPKRVGKYYACANFYILSATTNGKQAQLLAGSDVLARDLATIADTNAQNFTLCGIVNAASTAAITLKLQIAASTGTSTISNSGVDDHTIDWTIFQIDQALPAPLLVGSVVSNSSGVLKEIVANLNCDAGSAITSQTGSTSNGVASIGNISGGACAITLASGTFSTTPYCFATPNAAFAATGLIVSAASSSSTAVSIDCEDDASTACTSYDVNLLCKGAP